MACSRASTLGATDNGTPCYVATATGGAAAPGEDSGSGTISSTLPTTMTNFSTPDSTLAQDGSLASQQSSGSGKGYARGGAVARGRSAAGSQMFTAGPPGGPGQEATNALQSLTEADEPLAPLNMSQQEWDQLRLGPRDVRGTASDIDSDESYEVCDVYDL